jgi:hypothetical protein
VIDLTQRNSVIVGLTQIDLGISSHLLDRTLDPLLILLILLVGFLRVLIRIFLRLLELLAILGYHFPVLLFFDLGINLCLSISIVHTGILAIIQYL